MNRYTATMFILIAAILIAYVVSNVNMPTMDYSSSGNSAAVHHSTIKAIFKAHPDNNLTIPFLSESRYANDDTNVVDMLVSIIPNMLPNTSGECGEDSGISCN